ncbi:MAG TPA: CoA transferase [Syntrophorhabdaceae bacterium]|nr:CoA transferase [Syntrophorhabdaceae bacterium]
MLDNYRVLDLTDEKGYLGGKILGDLGADVVKIEPPSGDPGRYKGPFYHGIVDPGKSLPWLSLNANKRGITLDIETETGRDLFRKLAAKADLILESFLPGYMDSLGIGYNNLGTLNPRLIMTSITPFGQTGPYRKYKASDLTMLAMSGFTYINGDRDRPPLKMCLDQSYYLASAQAVAASLLALQYRYLSGKGQHIDVALYDVLVRANYREPFRWEWEKAKTPRNGNLFARGSAAFRQLWPSKDGYVTWMIMMENPKPVRAWVEWMKEENQAGRWGELNWDEIDNFLKWSSEDVQAIQESIAAFMRAHTTKELETASIRRGLLLSPVNPINALADDEQLSARGFWKKIAHPELNDTITYQRFTYLSSEGKNEIRFRAPQLGEHNEAIYGNELGLHDQDLDKLKKERII